jgi:antitoxin (DNA-binding transcriptional repressor) of toxin-antitoxin stability system
MTVATSSHGTTVGVRELKNQLSSFLDRVKAGEEITVTEHGRPIARLSAIGGDIDHMAELVAAGIVQPAAKPRRRLPARRVRLVNGASLLADIVSEQRG